MVYSPMTVEIDSAAAFLALAKDLKPQGKVIVYEKTGLGAYKFLTTHNGFLMGYQYNVRARHVVQNHEGAVTHTLSLGGDWNKITRHIMVSLDVHGRESARTTALDQAWMKLMSTSNPSTLRWTSRHEHVKNLRILIHNERPGRGAVQILYTNDHVRETSELLRGAGFRVVNGAIRKS